MKHVTDQLAAWLGGELTAAGSEAVRAHLEECADCRDEERKMRETWEILAVAAPSAERARADLWPAVRDRTFGRNGSGWFFGRTTAVRLSLAVATLAVGVLCGRMTGGLAAPRSALAEDDSGLAAVWLEDSTWHGDDGVGLTDSWLALAESGVDGPASNAQGGSR